MEEFNYLTDEDFSRCKVKITGPEIYQEVISYNELAEKERNSIPTINRTVYLWHIIQFFILFTNYLAEYYNHFYHLNVVRLCMVAYIFVYIYFIIIKKIREPKTVFCLSLFSVLVSWRLIILAVLNGFAAHLYQKHEQKQQKKPGYPYFKSLKMEFDGDGGYSENKGDKYV